MAIEIKRESLLRNDDTTLTYIERGDIGGFHDIIAGKLILARCLADAKGVDVHVLQGFHGNATELTHQETSAITNADNLYERLLPWFKITIPVNLQTGEPGSLTVRHFPSGIHLTGIPVSSID